MQSFLLKMFAAFGDFISPKNIKKILLKLKDYWKDADMVGRGLLVLFFAPALVVLFWLLAEVAYIVVFTLPGIVLKIFALMFLFGIFWSGAVFFYEKLHRVMGEEISPPGSPPPSEPTRREEPEKPRESEKTPADKPRHTINWRRNS